jgi:peptide/nickel transport system permease protein
MLSGMGRVQADGVRDDGKIAGPASIAVRKPQIQWTRIRHNRWALASAAFLLLVSLVAIFAPLIAPENYAGYDFRHGGAHPQLDLRYLLGSDVSGHSILSLLILGARTTVGMALLATVVAMSVGSLGAGATTASVPSWIKALAIFVAEAAATLPFLPLLLVLAAYVSGGNPWSIGLLFGLAGAPSVMVMLIRNAGRPRHMIRRQEWNILRLNPATRSGRAARAATLSLITFLVASATVDYLGFGLPASNPSWGNILSSVGAYLQGGYWWWVLFPGLAIGLTVLALNVLGLAIVNAAEAPTSS